MNKKLIKTFLLIFLTIIIKLLIQINSKEYKLQEPKPHKHRCAYYYKNNKENNNKNNSKEEDESKWLLKPSATACIDELSIIWPEETQINEETHSNKNKKYKKEANISEQKTICQQIFGKKEQEKTKLRSEACDNEWIQPLARKCRKTCGTCCELPEYQCEDQAHTESNQQKYSKKHSISCYTIKDINIKCQKNSVWYPTLIDHCQSTCGLCEINKKKEKKRRKIEEIKEENNDLYEKNDLKIPRRGLCNDRRGEKYCIKQILAKESDPCKDKPGFLDRCKKSCGVCLPKEFKCRDKESYRRKCALWNQNNFCSGTKYSKAVKLHYCAEHCKFCDRKDDEDYYDENDSEEIERSKEKWLI